MRIIDWLITRRIKRLTKSLKKYDIVSMTRENFDKTKVEYDTMATKLKDFEEGIALPYDTIVRSYTVTSYKDKDGNEGTIYRYALTEYGKNLLFEMAEKARMFDEDHGIGFSTQENDSNDGGNIVC